MAEPQQIIGEYNTDPTELLAFLLLIARQKRIEYSSATLDDVAHGLARLNGLIETAQDIKSRMEINRG